MLAQFRKNMALVPLIVLSACTGSLQSRDLPDYPSAQTTTVAGIRTAGMTLQSDYAKLIKAFEADTGNFNLAYILIGTFTAASAIFGAHPDYLKIGGLAAGVTTAAQETLSPKQKEDALFAANAKLACAMNASLPLTKLDSQGSALSLNSLQSGVRNALSADVRAMALFDFVQATTPTAEEARLTIESVFRQIHSDLINEFRSVRLDPKAQADRYIAAADEFAKFKRKKDEQNGAADALDNQTLKIAVSIAESNETFLRAIAETQKCAV